MTFSYKWSLDPPFTWKSQYYKSLKLCLDHPWAGLYIWIRQIYLVHTKLTNPQDFIKEIVYRYIAVVYVLSHTPQSLGKNLLPSNGWIITESLQSNLWTTITHNYCIMQLLQLCTTTVRKCWFVGNESQEKCNEKSSFQGISFPQPFCYPEGCQTLESCTHVSRGSSRSNAAEMPVSPSPQMGGHFPFWIDTVSSPTKLSTLELLGKIPHLKMTMFSSCRIFFVVSKKK